MQSDETDDEDQNTDSRPGSPVVLEEDPSGRYVKYDEVLHHGAFMEAFKGYDNEEGLDVAWYEFSREDHQWSESEQAEKDAIVGVVHTNIMRIHQCWMSEDEVPAALAEGRGSQSRFHYVTDYISPSGSLKNIVRGEMSASRRVKIIQSWSKQMLEGLAFLHSNNPPICHGGISLSTIYLQASSGTIKLCSPLRSFLSRGMKSEAPLATMAPELCGHTHDEKIDVYAFGMLMLEAVTLEKPYQECVTQGQLLAKISLGCLPNMLTRVRHSNARDFFQCCLRPVDQRASATELLNHPFLIETSEGSQTVEEGLLNIKSSVTSIPKPHSPRSDRTSITHVNATPPRMSGEEENLTVETDGTAFEVLEVAPAASFRTIRLVGRLSFQELCKEIELEFRLNEDTCSDVAEELVDAFDGDFPKLSSCSICGIIEKAIMNSDLLEASSCCQQHWHLGHCTCRTMEAGDRVLDPVGVDDLALWRRLDQLVISQEEELRQMEQIRQRHEQETQWALSECAQSCRR